MKKFFIFLICFVIFFSGSGCVKKRYRYMHDISNISSIEIVRVSKYNKDINGHPLQITLLTIKENSEFLNDLSEIEFTSVFGYAYSIEEDNAIAIKLMYNNNDYELITACGGANYYFSEDYYYPYAGEMTCNVLEFNALIDKYLQSTD